MKTFNVTFQIKAPNHGLACELGYEIVRRQVNAMNEHIMDAMVRDHESGKDSGEVPVLTRWRDEAEKMSKTIKVEEVR